ncbi:MAG: M48 family metallopeptidase [Armatimonadota bacterium]
MRKITVLIILAVIITTSFAYSFQLELISKEQEIQIGKDAASQIESEYGTVNNAAQLAKINKIGKKIVTVCDRRDLPYSFKILNTDQVNAICCPGGFIYVTKGLMNLKLSDDELACVLAHEITHAVKRHAVNQITATMGVGVLLDLVTKGQASQQLSGQVVQLLLTRGHSRDDEYDADLTGATYAFYAGYNPYGMIYFLQELNKLEKSNPTFLDQFIATHPPNNDRIARLKPLCKSLTGK